MLALMNELGALGADVLQKALGPDIAVGDVLSMVRAARPELGDLQCNAAMQLAKATKKPPRAIAELLVAGLHHPAIASARIDGPGFVNIVLSDAWVAAHAGKPTEMRQIGAGQRVVIDYSSPNVAKPMHIGHIRSTIIGEALKRVLRSVGYEVIADNHLGDWGTQFGKLIVAWRKWLDRAAYDASPVDELVRLYIKFTDDEKAERAALGVAATDEDDAPKIATPLIAAARAELVKLQQGDADNLALWREFIAVSQREFDRVYQRLDVHFDVTLGESFYNDQLAATVERLKAEGLAVESQGALVVLFEKDRDGAEMPPFLIQKGDGGFNYGTTDVAGMLYRMKTWQPTRILIVTDERQQLHFRQLFATARRLGITASLEHIWFGLMRLPEGTFSTRDGNVIGLEALLDEAERRADVVAAESNPELDAAKRKEVARVVGLGAVKYNDLSRDRQTLVTFTWDKALALTGNTAPYLQYAYARIRSILRKAEADGFVPGPLSDLSATERTLALHILGFDEAVETVAKSTRPHFLCDYLFALAQSYSTFYANSPVLKAEPAVRSSRLTLCATVAETLKRGLELLGIEVLEEM